MADSRDRAELKALRRQVVRLKAQNRRLVEDLDWAESQVRVFRRVIERLVRQDKS